MSIKTTIYRQLAGDESLSNTLARHKNNATKPAIYEGWAVEDSRKPYVNLTYSEIEGNHWARRDCSLTVDIFSENGSIEAEAIRNRIIRLLDRQILIDTMDRYTRCYLDDDSLTDDGESEIAHWIITFTVIYWRESFYTDLNEPETP